MKNSFKKLEARWILYDVGNSAFILLVSTIIPIYFDRLAQNAGISSVDYLAYWGYASAAATIIVAFSGPLLGTVSDKPGCKKPLFVCSIALGVLGCLALGFAGHWLAFLIVFIAARIGYSISLIFYDSMLSDITDESRMDMVSSRGYAWGYIGSCVPFAVCLGLVLGAGSIGISMTGAMLLSFLIVSVWWTALSVPLIKSYKQIHSVGGKAAANSAFTQLGHTIKEIVKNKRVFYFLIAFFFYIDGVYTIIDMATAYGSALGLDASGLLLALLVTQIVAFPSSITIGRLAQGLSSQKLIIVCISAYVVIAVFAMLMSAQLHFWILAVLVGMFQGGIQALSRSYYAKIIPPDKSGEYFGIMDICGKGASFFGMLVVSAVSQFTGSVNLGIGAIALFFIAGLILFCVAAKKPDSKE